MKGRKPSVHALFLNQGAFTLKVRLKRKESLFEFVRNPDVESTNNRAERAIRHSVISRKISGGSRSHIGAQVYGILTSVFHTIEQRGEEFINRGMKITLTSHG